MTTLSLTAKQDHLEKVAKLRDPIKAIAEFVWNSLDANATHVKVEFTLNKLDGIEAIRISDDGDGISYERATNDFSNLGDSWKKNARRKSGQRVYHGKEGRGRLRFYSLAQKAKWHSTYTEQNKYFDLAVEIDSRSLGKSNLSEPVESNKTKTGTLVELSPLKETFDWLRSEAARTELGAIFAPYLLRYPDVKISYDDTPIDPSDTVSHSHEFPKQIVICPNRTIKDLSVRVIEWRTHVENRKIHLGGENGIVLGSQPANVTAPDFEYSAYAYSKFFEEVANANLLEFDDLSDPDFKFLMDFIRGELSDYFRQRLAERSKNLIDELKSSGAYPYEGEPRDAVERTERQVFDIATYAVSSYSRDFKKADTSLKKMTLTLLREALRHNPDSLSTILRAVVNLPKSRQDELSGLLRKTELGNIISASSLIADRVTAVEMLKAMVFNPEYRHTIRERGELDVIVRDNTWIFGEQFHITMPEAGLTKIMDRVSTELGSKRRRVRVKKTDGKSGRADCFLGRSVPRSSGDVIEFIVVELKRPSLKIGRKEIDQLEDYVTALKSQPDFSHTNTTWNFFLITGEYEDAVQDRINQKDRAVGLFLETENSKVWVKTWSQILRDCETRLRFIQERLRVDVSDEDIAARISALRSSVLKEDKGT
jgi:hypothetical protein